MSIFKGAGVAIVTPMKENEEVNYEKLQELIEWQIDQGTDAIIIAGTTGESSTLTMEEHRGNGSITYGMRGQCRERDDTDYGTDVAGGGHRCRRRIHDGRKRTCYPAVFLVGRGDET